MVVVVLVKNPAPAQVISSPFWLELCHSPPECLSNPLKKNQYYSTITVPYFPEASVETMKITDLASCYMNSLVGAEVVRVEILEHRGDRRDYDC